MKKVAYTDFAPAERKDIKIVNRQFESFQKDKLLNDIADTFLEVLLVLNKERQIVFANQRLFDFLGNSNWDQILSKRPGELLDCVNANKSIGGCGTTEFCSKCGAVNAILESQNGTQAISECRIRSNNGTSFDFKVCATQYEHNGNHFTIFTLTDIGGDKRRETLERTFFHDILNTAGGVFTLSSILKDNQGLKDDPEISNMIFRSSDQLVKEILSQRMLLSAELGELKLSITKINSLELIKEITELYSSLEIAKGRNILIRDTSLDIDFYSDKALIGRILGNILKNAIEASIKKETVTILCLRQKDNLVFSVQNTVYMPRSVQLQIFQRSFSTKGPGRGIGTYSMKLFAEQYLKGKIWFTTEKSTGTTFYFSIPLKTENPE